MNILLDLDLKDLADRYDCRYFVETGGGDGAGVDQAQGVGFKHLYSIERDHARAITTAFRHAANLGITIIHGRPERGLKETLGELPAGIPVLFHLNAPPREDDLRKAETLGQLPLERQLRQIAETRDPARDVIVIDALRLYEDGAFEDGPCRAEDRPVAGLRDLGFVRDLLGRTHRLERLYRQAGALRAYPLSHRS
jgi:hypothetical protein